MVYVLLLGLLPVNSLRAVFKTTLGQFKVGRLVHAKNH